MENVKIAANTSPVQFNEKKLTPSQIATKTVIYVVTILISTLFFLPFLYMVYGSLQSTADTVVTWPLVAPSLKNIGNYAEAIRVMDFFNSLKNTLIILFSSTLLQVASSVLVAYGFARFRNKYTEPLFMLLLSTMMLPWIVTMVPSYVIYAELGFISSSSSLVKMSPLIISAIGGSAYNVYMLRNFMRGIPKSIDEAAEIDGCSSLGILVKILLPNMKPIIATMLIFAVKGGWSAYVGPSIYITDQKLYPLALSIGLFQGNNSSTELHWQMAGCTLYCLPLLVLLFSAQKVFMRGIVTTSVKG